MVVVAIMKANVWVYNPLLDLNHKEPSNHIVSCTRDEKDEEKLFSIWFATF